MANGSHPPVKPTKPNPKKEKKGDGKKSGKA